MKKIDLLEKIKSGGKKVTPENLFLLFVLQIIIGWEFLLEFFKNIKPKTVLVFGTLLIVLRLFFPVLHIQMNYVGNSFELCVSHFSPISQKCKELADKLEEGEQKNLFLGSIKTDSTRTYQQALGISILFLLIYFLKTKKD
jgi:hypothetical protein